MKHQTLASSDDQEVESKKTPQELLNEIRAGQSDAAYELLGRPAPVKAWREALNALRSLSDAPDIELAAHRALRRPPEVASSLLALVDSVGTPKAAFVAHALAVLRGESSVKRDAQSVRDRILGEHDFELALAGGEGQAVLYLVLCRSLEQQRVIAGRLRSEPASLEVVARALSGEYQRLLELGRTVRWTSGSYRYFLRHSLADLALISAIGGRVEDLAYRLLQQQVDNPSDNEELIEHLPAETRARFLNWALERENATPYPARTRFVLGITPRYPEEVGRAAVIALAESKEPDVSADAIVLAVRLSSEASDVDRVIAERINDSSEEKARKLVSRIAEIAPARLRLDLISSARRQLVVDVASPQAQQIAGGIAAIVARSTDVEQAQELLGVLEALDVSGSIEEELFEQTAVTVLARAEHEPMWRSRLPTLLAGQAIQRAAWNVLPSLADSSAASTYSLLVAGLDAVAAGQRSVVFLGKNASPGQAVVDAVARLVCEGAVEIDPLSAIKESTLELLAERARTLTVNVEAELRRARPLLASGEQAAEDELRGGLAPIVRQAISRAEGNSRLQNAYSRLIASSHAEPAADTAAEIPPSAGEELGALGAKLSDGSVTLAASDSGPSPEELRYLALLDQRSAKGQGAAGWAELLAAYVGALGDRGDASSLTHDLFERGSAFRLLVGLSVTTRTLLVLAAVRCGLEVPAGWYEVATFGPWLATIVGYERPDSEHDADPISALQSARTRVAEADRVRDAAERLRHGAKLHFVASSRQAFDELEATIDGFVQLWNALGRIGISQVSALGSSIESAAIDPGRHEIIGGPGACYRVRTAGLVVDGQIVAKARVEAID